VPQLKLTYSKDGSDNEAMEFLQSDFIRLGEGDVEFFARIIHATTQSLGSEVKTSVSERQQQKKMGGQNEVTVTKSERHRFHSKHAYLLSHKSPSVAVLFFSGASAAHMFSRVSLAVGLVR
jgi:hypothetical protein